MMKRVTVLINLFRRKSGVHPVLSPRQISFGKKIKISLCKIGELVMVYDVKASNKTSHPRTFYVLYIGPNDSSTGHSVFKLSAKQLFTIPTCKHMPMPEDVIQAVNKIGRQEGMPDKIQFRNIHKESTLLDLYADNDSQDNNSCTSNNNWKMEEKAKEDLKKLEFDIDGDNNEIEDLNSKDALHLNDGLARMLKLKILEL